MTHPKRQAVPWCLALVLLILPGRTAAMAAVRGPFTDVPQQHWAYDAVRQLAQRGLFTGYPDGSFSGKRALTRYEFAVAIQRMLQEAGRLIGQARSFPVQANGQALLRSDLGALIKLVQEFREELAMLGSDPDQLRRDLVALSDRLARIETGIARMSGDLDLVRRPWRHDPPNLAFTPPQEYPGIDGPESSAYQRGILLAAREWRQGETAYYVTAWSAGGISVTNGIAYRPYGKRADDPAVISLIAGHHAEINRRIAQIGLPKCSRLRWIDQIERQTEGWGTSVKRIALDRLRSDGMSPDGQILVHLTIGEGGGGSLRVALPERLFELSLPDLAAGGRVQVRWGAGEADLLFLRYPGKQDGQTATVFQVIDQRSGAVLRTNGVSGVLPELVPRPSQE